MAVAVTALFLVAGLNNVSAPGDAKRGSTTSRTTNADLTREALTALEPGLTPESVTTFEGPPGVDPTATSESITLSGPDAEQQMRGQPVASANRGLREPFYGLAFVPETEMEAFGELGIEVVLLRFDRAKSPADWLGQLNRAQSHGFQVITWLWPEGWSWDGSTWQIDDQARAFVETVATHPATFAVYALHEPYWRECWGCGYTTRQQQLLYDAIKAIADVPIYSDLGSVSFWTAQGKDTAFSDGVCDYCGNWYYPFLEDGTYAREDLYSKLQASLAVTRERAPNSKFVWLMQSYAKSGEFRMPTAEEMRDLASLVFSMDVDGALWYVGWFGSLYSDFLSSHPELFPTVREIYDDVVVPSKD
jgi:hypothetical protein